MNDVGGNLDVDKITADLDFFKKEGLPSRGASKNFIRS